MRVCRTTGRKPSPPASPSGRDNPCVKTSELTAAAMGAHPRLDLVGAGNWVFGTHRLNASQPVTHVSLFVGNATSFRPFEGLGARGVSLSAGQAEQVREGESLGAGSALSIDRGQVGVGLAVESSQRALLRALAAEGCLDPELAGALDDADVCRSLPVHGAGARSHRRGVLFRRLPQQFVTLVSVFAAGSLACSRSGQAPRELAQALRSRAGATRPPAAGVRAPSARLPRADRAPVRGRAGERDRDPGRTR